jgi:hypothetical protein
VLSAAVLLWLLLLMEGSGGASGQTHNTLVDSEIYFVAIGWYTSGFTPCQLELATPLTLESATVPVSDSLLWEKRGGAVAR